MLTAPDERKRAKILGPLWRNLCYTDLCGRNQHEGSKMDRDFIITSIGSYRERLSYENRRAITAIVNGEYVIAADAVAQASAYKGAIDELELLLDVEEVM